MKIFSAFI